MRNGILPGTFVEVCLHSAVNKYLNNFFFSYSADEFVRKAESG